MAKNKIQVGTVRQMANVEVIFINSRFVIKLMEAHRSLIELYDYLSNPRNNDNAASFAIDLDERVLPFFQELQDALVRDDDNQEGAQ